MVYTRAGNNYWRSQPVIEISLGGKVGGQRVWAIFEFTGITNPRGRREKTSVLAYLSASLSFFFSLSLSLACPLPSQKVWNFPGYSLLVPIQNSVSNHPRLICIKMLSIIISWITLYTFKSYFRFEKQSGSLNMESSRTTSFIHFFFFHSFVSYKKMVEKEKKSHVRFSARWYLSVIGKLHLKSKRASLNDGNREWNTMPISNAITCPHPSIFPFRWHDSYIESFKKNFPALFFIMQGASLEK